MGTNYIVPLWHGLADSYGIYASGAASQSSFHIKVGFPLPGNVDHQRIAVGTQGGAASRLLADRCRSK
jgi:hypothetical protein